MYSHGKTSIQKRPKFSATHHKNSTEGDEIKLVILSPFIIKITARSLLENVSRKDISGAHSGPHRQCPIAYFLPRRPFAAAWQAEHPIARNMVTASSIA
jgi:hypothetical protein